jgi:hypothetical protein
LLLAASLTPACIIPVGPEWHDPLGVPNAAPEILNPKYEEGDTVSGNAQMPVTFEFSVADVNDDVLILRVIVDGTALPERTLGRASEAGRVAFLIQCINLFDKTTTRHLIKAAVADRAFTSDTLGVVDGGKVTIIPWTLNMTCPL